MAHALESIFGQKGGRRMTAIVGAVVLLILVVVVLCNMGSVGAAFAEMGMYLQYKFIRRALIVGMLVALCATDSILLLDEPVTGLDPEATEEFYSIVRRLNREHGVAIVMVSHDLHGSMRDAGKVLVMNHGVDFLGAVADYEAKFERRVSG